MPFDGNGNYSPPSPAYPAVSGTTITADNRNTIDADIAAAFTKCVTRDGQSPMQAALPMGGNKITGIAAAAALTDVPQSAQVQNAAFTALTTVAGTNTVTASAFGLATLALNQSFTFIAAGTNTGATTLNINGLGAKSIFKQGSTPLAGNEILAGQSVYVTYDGTQFQLLSTGSRTFRGTAVTGQTLAAVDFTGIPAWANEIIIEITDLGLTSASHLVVLQVGSLASGIESTSYSGAAVTTLNGSPVAGVTSLSYFPLVAAYGVLHCTARLTRVSGNNWVLSAVGSIVSLTGTHTAAGRKTMTGGALDRVRITTDVADTFSSAGALINISYRE